MNKLFQNLKLLLSKNRPFFKLASEGKRITHIAFAIPLILGFIFGGAVLGQLIIYRLFVKRLNLSSNGKELFGLIVVFACASFCLWLWVKFFEKRPFWTIGLVKKNAIKLYLKGFTIGLTMISIIVLFMFLIGKAEFSIQNNTQFSLGILGMVFLFLIGFIIQGGTEELLARGWQFQVIGARYNPTLGLAITSVIFALLHGINDGISIIAIFNLILFALLLSFYTLKYNNLWVACGWHSAWNWTMSCVYGLNVSGQRIENSFFKIDFIGPKYITGGLFGPEGSIATTLLLISAIIIIIYRNVEDKESIIIVQSEN